MLRLVLLRLRTAGRNRFFLRRVRANRSVALNLIQRLSGVATLARRYVDAVQLSDADRTMVYEGTARRVYPRLDARLKARSA